jgi:hypothetical protein
MYWLLGRKSQLSLSGTKLEENTSSIHSSEGTSAALQSKKKSAVTALTMVINFAPIPII